MHERVLVVEDEDAIRELVVFHLQRAGFDIQEAPDAAAALAAVERWRPEVVVLDLMLPDASGLDVCRRLRERGADLQWPGIIMLTALNEEGDRVAGLEVGADDYVTKPFSPRELVARVRAVLRRRRPPEPAPPEHGTSALSAGDLRVDLDRHRVEAGGVPVEGLTATEFRLLATLVERAGRVLTRDQLIDRVWGSDFFGDPRTVDVHVRHIREKLARAGLPDAIETVRGFGYRVPVRAGRD
jgi:DNA-binding response OmpR family regulator